jgi:HK97 family phage prohead protease
MADSRVSTTERRFTPGRVEVRAASERRTIGGYAAKFNRPSQNLGGFVERIAPTAFNRSRGNDWPDVMARYNHDDNQLLGTTAAQTLRLSVDDTGLVYEVDVPDAEARVFELVSRGDITKSSFAFAVIGEDGDEWDLSDQGFPQRTLVSVDLVDVAPVNRPAYLDTSAGIRSLARHVHAPVDEVRQLAEANDLKRFFVRSDRPPVGPKTFGPAALAALLARKQDPWSA